jgi:hypothetical protein
MLTPGPTGQNGAVAQQQRIRRRAPRREPEAAAPPMPIPRSAVKSTRGVGHLLDRIHIVLSEARR